MILYVFGIHPYSIQTHTFLRAPHSVFHLLFFNVLDSAFCMAKLHEYVFLNSEHIWDNVLKTWSGMEVKIIQVFVEGLIWCRMVLKSSCKLKIVHACKTMCLLAITESLLASVPLGNNIKYSYRELPSTVVALHKLAPMLMNRPYKLKYGYYDF